MTKSLIRSGSRRGVRDDKTPRVEQRTSRLSEPAACERCGATFVRRTWRRGRSATAAFLARVTWTVCPACTQAAEGEYFGRVLIGGGFAKEHEAAIRARIANVDARARFTQPERRVIAGVRRGDVLEVLTTSQKLAHRIVHELKKTFRGRATYQWSETDGSLFATWQRD
jgi:hypothetical protein